MIEKTSLNISDSDETWQSYGFLFFFQRITRIWEQMDFEPQH
ncbi:hypothetical protein IC582_017895 [Cucumis melo]